MIRDAITLLEKNRNEIYAKQMKRYMKNHFDFYGVSSPKRKELFSAWIKDHRVAEYHTIKEVVNQLWKHPYREAQYIAMSLLDKHLKYVERDDEILLEDLITTKSWWDTVDWLASHGVGDYLKKYPEKKYDIIEKWSNSGNMWLIRTTIIFQLFYKNETDEDLLAALILQHLDTGEFFINKAAGWALRQYSKTNRTWVSEFIDTHQNQLHKLTVKEGLKWIDKNN